MQPHARPALPLRLRCSFACAAPRCFRFYAVRFPSLTRLFALPATPSPAALATEPQARARCVAEGLHALPELAATFLQLTLTLAPSFRKRPPRRTPRHTRFSAAFLTRRWTASSAVSTTRRKTWWRTRLKTSLTLRLSATRMRTCPVRPWNLSYRRDRSRSHASANNFLARSFGSVCETGGAGWCRQGPPCAHAGRAASRRYAHAQCCSPWRPEACWAHASCGGAAPWFLRPCRVGSCCCGRPAAAGHAARPCGCLVDAVAASAAPCSDAACAYGGTRAAARLSADAAGAV